jgi:hypothetical protein
MKTGPEGPVSRTVLVHFLTAGIEPARRLTGIPRRPMAPAIIGKKSNIDICKVASSADPMSAEQ